MREGFARLSLDLTGPHAKQHFALLRDNYKDALEEKLGALDWRELPDAKVSRVWLQRPATPADRATWPELDAWLAENVEQWVAVLKPIVASLDASDYADSPTNEPTTEGTDER
jgi:hypothetical protein